MTSVEFGRMPIRHLSVYSSQTSQLLCAGSQIQTKIMHPVLPLAMCLTLKSYRVAQAFVSMVVRLSFWGMRATKRYSHILKLFTRQFRDKTQLKGHHCSHNQGEWSTSRCGVLSTKRHLVLY